MTEPVEKHSKLPYLLRTFRYRNYRLFFTGQTIALNGMWMTMAAMGWLLYRLTDNPLTLGMMVFFMQGPVFLLTSFGGLLVDRVSRRKIIIIAQGVDGVLLLILAFLTLMGWVEVVHILGTCLLIGVVKAFEMPARQALVADIVEDVADLPNAIALNSTIFHSARLIGPILAGVVLIPFGGEGLCFLIHSLCGFGSIRCFYLLRPKPYVPETSDKSLWGQLVEGFYYGFGYPPVRDLLLLMIAISLMGVPYNTLLPVFARTILEGDSGLYGILLASSGMGAMLAAVHLASRSSVLGIARIIAVSAMSFGVALFFFAISANIISSAILLFFVGGSSIYAMVGANTIIQILVEDRLRGRVMSLFGMVFMGAVPIGSLIVAKFASIYGAPLTLAFTSLGTILAGIVFLLRLPNFRRRIQPVYEERGVFPTSNQSSPNAH